MLIRNFQGKDIYALIDLWNTVLPEHALDRRAFVKNVLLDMNFDPNGFLIAEENDELIGFLWAIVRRYPVDIGAVSEEDIGYLNVIGVKDNTDDTVAVKLVSAAEKYVTEKGKHSILVSGYSPNYVYPGINTRYTFYKHLFEKLGYQEYKRNRSIGADLHRIQLDDELESLRKQREKEGYAFLSLRDEYIPSLLNFANPSFTHRYRRLIGETMDYDRVRLIVYDEKVIGCAVFGDPYSSDERFGPYTVSEEHRGKGLGKLLLYDTLLAMKRKGLRHAWAQSTPMGGAAATAYARFGFVATDEFISYKKEITR